MATATATPPAVPPVKNRQLYINGEWCDSSSGKKLAVENPATEETIAEVALGTREDCKRAIGAAAEAMKSWMKLTPYDRAKVLKKTADLMRERADSLARTMTMEQGKPVAEAKGEVMHSADTFEWFAEEGKRAYGQVIPQSNPAKRHLTIKHPVGVVGAIGPWNFPITLQSRKIAPALAAGCTIVCTPARRLFRSSESSSASSTRACRRALRTWSSARPGKSRTSSCRTRRCGRSASPVQRQSESN